MAWTTTALQQPRVLYFRRRNFTVQNIIYSSWRLYQFPTHIHVLIAVVVVVSTRYNKNSSPPRDRGNLLVNKNIERAVSNRFVVQQSMPAAQLLHRKIHSNSVRGAVKITTAGTYSSYCCSIDWLLGSRCCRCH